MVFKRFQNRCSDPRVCLREFAYHIFFGCALLCMSALLIWWIIYIGKSVDERHQIGLNMLDMISTMHATVLGNEDTDPQPGLLKADTHLEVVKCSDIKNGKRFEALPKWPTYCVRPRAEIIIQLNDKFQRQRLMVSGESTLVIMLLFISVFMLYRFVGAEKRFLRQLETMLASVVHEIKTPAAGIKALLQTLESGRIKPENIAAMARAGVREIDRQEHLIENLLQNQRLRYRPESYRIESLPLRIVLTRLYEHRLITCDREPFRLECRSDLYVMADQGALEVILENLLDNAVKYGGNDISISAEEQGEWILTHVSDDGIGFDPQKTAALFRPYHRAKQFSKATKHGSGLGLYLSQRLALQMGGDLYAESAGEGRGSRFSIKLKKGSGNG